MPDGYTWKEFRGADRVRLPGPDHVGWWVSVSLLLAVILHAIAFLALGRIKVALGFEEAEEIRTAPVSVDRVEVMPPPMDDLRPEPVESMPPDTASLLEEIDILSSLPEDMEMDITPQTLDPEFAIKPQQPLKEGAPEELEFNLAEEFELDTELPEPGRTEDPLPPAAEGQVVVDPGDMELEDPALDEFTREILERGAGGAAAEGALDGVVTLDDMVGLPENVLVGKKTMLPSDLLFEYNSADLRESARVGLMKLALLVERNPGLYCWIEGHTDRIGGEAFNLDLSKSRARAVRNYLTGSLRLDGERISTIGFGETRPLAMEGGIEEQAINRRVEIKMRRNPPPKDLEPGAPVAEEPASESTPPEPEPKQSGGGEAEQGEKTRPTPKAVLVKPARKLPTVDDVEGVPRAQPVEEPLPPRARAVEEIPPRANPVTE